VLLTVMVMMVLVMVLALVPRFVSSVAGGGARRIGTERGWEGCVGFVRGVKARILGICD
jgi:hypothetical protein